MKLSVKKAHLVSDLILLYNGVMERLTAIILLFFVPFIIVGCAVKKQEKASRLPASIATPLDNETDMFIEEIEESPSGRY